MATAAKDVLPEKYQFDPEFQRGVVTLLLKDPTFLLSYRDVLDPYYFEDPLLEGISAVAVGFFDEHGKPPSLVSLRQELAVSDRVGLDADGRSQARDVAVELFREELADADYVRSKAIKFGEHQALRIAVLEGAVDLSGNGADYDAIAERIDKARTVGTNMLERGRRYIEQRKDRRGKTSLDLLGSAIPTGLRSLDRALSGGIRPSQLGILAAPPKRGKSLFLINFAASGIAAGKFVVYYTLEMETAIVEERIDQRILNASREDVQTRFGELEIKLEGLSKKGGELLIKSFPLRSASVRTMRDHLKITEGECKRKPDLVIVDYLQLVKPSRVYKDDTYKTVGSVAEDLKAMAQTLKMPVWSAQQINRGGLKKDPPDEADLAESFVSAQVCDIMGFLCQTDEDQIAKRMKVHLGLNRNGPQGVSVRLVVDKSHQWVQEDSSAPVATTPQLAALPKPKPRAPSSPPSAGLT